MLHLNQVVFFHGFSWLHFKHWYILKTLCKLAFLKDLINFIRSLYFGLPLSWYNKSFLPIVSFYLTYTSNHRIQTKEYIILNYSLNIEIINLYLMSIESHRNYAINTFMTKRLIDFSNEFLITNLPSFMIKSNADSRFHKIVELNY